MCLESCIHRSHLELVATFVLYQCISFGFLNLISTLSKALSIYECAALSGKQINFYTFNYLLAPCLGSNWGFSTVNQSWQTKWSWIWQSWLKEFVWMHFLVTLSCSLLADCFPRLVCSLLRCGGFLKCSQLNCYSDLISKCNCGTRRK